MIENIALRNDYMRLKRLGNPRYFSVTEMPNNDPSVELLVRCELHDVTTELVNNWREAPHPAQGGCFYMRVYKPYPQGDVKVYFNPEEGMPNHVHVWQSGEVCFDGWIPEHSSLAEVAEKVIRCMLYDPAAFHYDPVTHNLTSMANRTPYHWVMENMERFPLFPPERVLCREVVVRTAPVRRPMPTVHTEI